MFIYQGFEATLQARTCHMVKVQSEDMRILKSISPNFWFLCNSLERYLQYIHVEWVFFGQRSVICFGVFGSRFSVIGSWYLLYVYLSPLKHIWKWPWIFRLPSDDWYFPVSTRLVQPTFHPWFKLRHFQWCFQDSCCWVCQGWRETRPLPEVLREWLRKLSAGFIIQQSWTALSCWLILCKILSTRCQKCHQEILNFLWMFCSQIMKRTPSSFPRATRVGHHPRLISIVCLSVLKICSVL